ncbi:alpha/beta hydrolase [Sulfurospirillum oryzae]|uniref:alpha/beta hydrolase n=1 Tax=Sulfurospirillum oryzae TaxID=2976535 RepID=UPI0021E816D7|nr:alpha/beta hydrolase [Sulfurospirillum oryzae]
MLQKIFLVLFSLTLFQSLQAGILRDRLGLGDEEEEKEATFSKEVQLIANVSYGNNAKERFDVYTPLHVNAQSLTSVIFMVHGGAWRTGDKKMQNVVENKVNYWVAKGYIVISTNYKLLPDASVSEQLNDVAKALGVAQAKSASWGGDKAKFIVMGHSAGAHLIALLASSQTLYASNAITPPMAAVLLDSAVMDTPMLMSAKHMRLYDQAFGNDPAYWQSLSPYHQLTTKRMPLLAVCSTKRDDSCPQAEKFLNKASTFGTKTVLLKENMTHKEINQLLGKDPAYTKAVDDFLTQ